MGVPPANATMRMDVPPASQRTFDPFNLMRVGLLSPKARMTGDPPARAWLSTVPWPSSVQYTVPVRAARLNEPHPGLDGTTTVGSGPHEPARQTTRGAHAWPHAPQFLVSV